MLEANCTPQEGQTRCGGNLSIAHAQKLVLLFQTFSIFTCAHAAWRDGNPMGAQGWALPRDPAGTGALPLPRHPAPYPSVMGLGLRIGKWEKGPGHRVLTAKPCGPQPDHQLIDAYAAPAPMVSLGVDVGKGAAVLVQSCGFHEDDM